MKKKQVSLPTEHAKAISRVLQLVDGYASTLPQDTLITYNGGLMTWRELRQHLQSANKLLASKKIKKEQVR